MKDIEISRKFGLPISTIQDWKKADKDTWRYKVYIKLKDDNPSCERLFVRQLRLVELL